MCGILPDDMAIFLDVASLFVQSEVKGMMENSRSLWMQALSEAIRHLGHLSTFSAVFLFSVETQNILYASAGMNTLLGEDPSSVVGANPITSGLIHSEDVNHFIATALDCCQRQRRVVTAHAMGRTAVTRDMIFDSLGTIRIRLRRHDGKYSRALCSLFATDHMIATFCVEDPVSTQRQPW